MDSILRAALDRAERVGYLPALRSIAKISCVPFWWHGPQVDGSYRTHHSGTVSFLDTGAKLIAISASHVFDGYAHDKQEFGNVTCQFGGMTIEPELRIISRQSELDLVTFEISPVIAASSGAYPHSPPQWPTNPVLQGDLLMVGGYPGTLRVEHSESADIPFQWFSGRVTSTSSSNIILHIDRDNFHCPLNENQLTNQSLGGLSGGPVFRVVTDPIERLELVGVIYEYQETLGLVYARPARCITKEGSIDADIAA